MVLRGDHPTPWALVHVLYDSLTKLTGSEQRGAFHKAVKVVRDPLLGDGAFDATKDQISRFVPT